MAATAFSTVFLWLMLGLGIAVPVLIVFNAWLVDQTLTTSEALVALAGLVIGFIAIWASWGSAWVFLWVAALVAGSASLPFLGAARNKRALRRLTEDSIEKYRRTLELDPKNAAAYGYLADAYMECGRVDEAIAAYEAAIELSPKHSAQERVKLQRARESQQSAAR